MLKVIGTPGSPIHAEDGESLDPFGYDDIPRNRCGLLRSGSAGCVCHRFELLTWLLLPTPESPSLVVSDAQKRGLGMPSLSNILAIQLYSHS